MKKFVVLCLTAIAFMTFSCREQKKEESPEPDQPEMVKEEASKEMQQELEAQSEKLDEIIQELDSINSNNSN